MIFLGGIKVKLDLYLLEGYVYKAGTRSIPLVIEITSETEKIISDKIDIREIMLYQAGEEKFGAFIASVLSLPKHFYTISENAPRYMVINIADYDDSELLQGDYDIHIRVVIYESVQDGKYKSQELKTTKNISII